MAISTKMNNEATEYTKGLHSEKAILLEEILIGAYEDKIGKFSVPIITPTNSNYSDPVDNITPPVSTGNIISDGPVRASSYVQSNYIELKIPKYIVMNFTKKIPKLTEFIVIFIGDSYELDDVKIIGVC